jgi:hypothetical protein
MACMPKLAVAEGGGANRFWEAGGGMRALGLMPFIPCIRVPCVCVVCQAVQRAGRSEKKRGGGKREEKIGEKIILGHGAGRLESVGCV